ncbi:ASNS [Symbiodinium natans]|uniref:ASNS protein n=1 Tax=Symbiodinium natans TaxID=878477 RepID=A0A812UXL5_9DINO|nr:ASNS [Symbiodinium natans]
MCSFLLANFLINNLTYANYFLQFRGPDATNRWKGYGYDFVHNLLHMTGERVLQPFQRPEDGLVALFNGEIYNWQDLQGAGGSFRSDGDAILSEYVRFGQRFPRHLDGEYAIAVLDFVKREVILARDTFGTKPLWYAKRSGKFAVSSYASALLRLGFEDEDIRQIEPNSIAVFQLPEGDEVAEALPPAEADEAFPPQAPRLVKKLAVFEFDLRQHKTDTKDWKAAFQRAVQRRAGMKQMVVGRETPAMCLSDGYDSGGIALSLGKLEIQTAMYTVQAREDVTVLVERFFHLRKRGMNATWKLTRLSTESFEQEKTFLREAAERVQYKLRPGYANVDDKAAAGLSWIYRQARTAGQRLFLSGSGADESISDYGNAGRALEFHSTLKGVFPANLWDVFPWLNFFRGTQQDYLAKEECTAGAHGIEARYPFLDRSLVQEYLWLTADLKNSLYKLPLHQLLEEEQFPFTPGVKRGFSADLNLAGADAEAQAQARRKDDSAELRERFWASLGVAGNGTVVVASCSRCGEVEMESEEMSMTTLPAHPQRLMDVVSLARAKGRWRWPRLLRKRLRRKSDRRWAEIMQMLPAGQRAREAQDQAPVTPPLSLAAAAGADRNHRVVILTSCMEDHYFLTYCGPLFVSVAETFDLFGANAGSDLVMGLVSVVGVTTKLLEVVTQSMPFVEFVPFEEHDQYLSDHSDPFEAENYRKLTYQPLKLYQYLWLWRHKLVHIKEIAYILCMDSDMLVVRPFMHVLELLSQLEVDVSFSYYDGTRHVPWGTPEELAVTKKRGLVRLQGGLLIMRNSVEALQWFATWESLTESVYFEREAEGHLGDRWRDLLQDFKGPSQAALAFLLTRSELEVMQNVSQCCNTVRVIELAALRKGDPPVPVTMFGLPTQYVNDAESTEDGALPKTAHLIHLKGIWWRSVLPEGKKNVTAPTRTYEWNREAFDLWERHYATFLELLRQRGIHLDFPR